MVKPGGAVKHAAVFCDKPVIKKRGYLLEVTARRPKETTLRRLVERLALLRYNELFLYDAGAGGSAGETIVRYAAMKGVEILEIGEEELRELRREGVIEVATEAARSLAGRVEAMRERMALASVARIGDLRPLGEGASRVARHTMGDRRPQVEAKVERFLVTDFSDGRDWHSPIISLPGIVMGGYFAMIGAKAAKMDLEREVAQFLDAPLAGTLLKLGTLYLRGGAYREDSSEYFNILAGDRGYSRHPGITDFVLEEVSSVLRGVMKEAERHLNRGESAQEILYTALLLDASCHRKSEVRLKTVKEEFVKMWNRHYEPAGRDAAASKLPRF